MPDCAYVFERATTANNAGNRLWTYNAGTSNAQQVNPAGTVIITPPGGATYTAVCTNDDIYLAQTAGCRGGPIAATTIFSSANVFHGSIVTYRATAVVSTGLIAPTSTTCNDYAAGNAPTEPGIFAQFKDTKINSVAPGVFFYYATLTKAASEGVVITQAVSPTPPNLPPYGIQQGQAYLYNSSCDRVATLSTTNDGSSLPAGTYILGVKYATDAAKGTTVLSNALRTSGALLATHNYQATVGGTPDPTTAASVNTNTK